MATKQVVAGAIAMVKVAYPNWNVDIDQAARVWLKLLGDLEDDIIQTAVIALITEGDRKFAPSVGEIRGKVADLYAQISGVPNAWDAYEEVVQMPASMVKRNVSMEDGGYVITETPLKFSHPLVESVARGLGFPGRFPTDMPGVDRSQFEKAYAAEVKKQFGAKAEIKMVSDYVEAEKVKLLLMQSKNLLEVK